MYRDLPVSLTNVSLLGLQSFAEARMAELADAGDLKSLARKGVRVRAPLWALNVLTPYYQ